MAPAKVKVTGYIRVSTQEQVSGFGLDVLVRAGATFRKGVLVESEAQEGEVAA